MVTVMTHCAVVWYALCSWLPGPHIVLALMPVDAEEEEEEAAY